MAEDLNRISVAWAWFEAFAAKDVDRAVALSSVNFFRVADDTRWQPVTRAAWAEGAKSFFAAFPDWSRKLRQKMVSDNWLICQFTEQGTFTEPYRAMSGAIQSPTGMAFSDQNCDWLRVENGLVVELRSYVTNNRQRLFDFQRLEPELQANKSVFHEPSRVQGRN